MRDRPEVPDRPRHQHLQVVRGRRAGQIEQAEDDDRRLESAGGVDNSLIRTVRFGACLLLTLPPGRRGSGSPTRRATRSSSTTWSSRASSPPGSPAASCAPARRAGTCPPAPSTTGSTASRSCTASAFTDGAVSYGSRFLRSKAFRHVEETGALGFREFATDPCRSAFQRVSSLFAPDITDNGAVNVTRLGDRYLALTETPLPVAFDPETLETLRDRGRADRSTSAARTRTTTPSAGCSSATARSSRARKPGYALFTQSDAHEQGGLRAVQRQAPRVPPRVRPDRTTTRSSPRRRTRWATR